MAGSLQARRQERDALLERIVRCIQEDKRVVAAWLAGSLGRGEGDDLSDIDIWIVVADNYSRYVIAGRRAFVQRVEMPLLMKEAPQNAPQDGGYLLTLHSGTLGPHQVDWYWQAQSKATLPADATVLFDKVGIPPESASEVSAAQRAAEVSERVAFFWAMIGITAKKVARRQPWAALTMIGMVQNTLAEIQRGLGHARGVERHSDLPPTTPEDQMQRLRILAGEIQALEPEITTMGSDPALEAAIQVLRLFDLAEAILNEPQGDVKSG
ncbi:MAG TPA: nucleotidyltransferase domain-containing protein [Chthonomonadaceae bacterium]|nr:nucleotidyltransferase domain-containing protein [Chthonomonadaceae bacterium]